MESIHNSPPSNDANKRGRNQTWTPYMDKTLFEFLDSQVADGKKCQNGFRDSTYVQVAQVVNAAHGLNLNKEHVRNRVKSVKKIFRTILAIINSSGFAWSSELQQFTYHDEGVWNSYVLEHPEAKPFLNKKFEFFEIWENLFGQDTATRQWARTRRSSQTDHQNQSEAMDGDQINFGDISMGSEVNESQQNFSSSQIPITQPFGEGTSHQDRPTPPSKQRERRGVYAQQMTNIAQSLNVMANAFREKDLTPLLSAIQEIPNIPDDIVERSFEYLSENPMKANVFMTYDVSRRASFLQRLWQS